MKIKCKMFGGDDSLGQNALMQALEDCAKDHGHNGGYAIYNYLEDTPKGTLIVNLTDKLKEYGLKIQKIEPISP